VIVITQNRYCFVMAGCVLVLLSLYGCSRHEAGPERQRVRIAVPSPSLTYLPIYLARELGYYEEEGLDVTTEDVPGGAKALQAMLGGSVDVAASFFEYAIQLNAEGRRVQSFLTLLDRPGLLLAVSPTSARSIKRVEDLKGAVIGVSTPGSASHLFVNYLLVRHGVSPHEVSITGIGLGASSAAAFERGHIDAGVLTGSAITAVQRRFPKLVVLADARTADGVKEIFGIDVYPAHDLLASEEWLHRHPATARKLVGAVHHATEWMRQHSPEEIRRRMPAQYRAPDQQQVDLDALRATIPMLSREGRVSPVSAEAVRKVLAVSSEKVRNASIDLAQTYTNEFVPSQQK
jgi:NitT/TauT family transport system substrate-binding protein